MSFDGFMSDNRHLLLAYYALGKWCGGELGLIERPYPPAELSDEEWDTLQSRLRGLMPLTTIITDLWDWDVQFQDDLGFDWFCDTAFGPSSSEEYCADVLADYFLEKVAEYSMDYNQDDDYDGFVALLRKESIEFVRGWRSNLQRAFVNAVDDRSEGKP